MAFCPNCGKQIEDSASKCASCGNEVAPAAKPAAAGGGAKFKGTMMMPGAAAADLQAKIAEAKAKTAAAEQEQPAEQEPPPAAAPEPAGGVSADPDFGLQATMMGGPSFPGMISPAGIAAPPATEPAPQGQAAPEPAAEPAAPAEPPGPKVTPKGTMLGIAGPGGIGVVPPVAAPPAAEPSAPQPGEEPQPAEPPAGLFGQSEGAAPPSVADSIPESPAVVPGVSTGGLGKLMQEPRGRLILAGAGVGLLIVLALLARLLF